MHPAAPAPLRIASYVAFIFLVVTAASLVVAALALVGAVSAAAPAAAQGTRPEARREARPEARRDGTNRATALRLIGDERRSRLTVVLDRVAPFTTYALANPYRIVVDLPGVSFSLPAKSVPPAGLILAARHGLVTGDVARIVLETRGPVRIDAANVIRLPGRPQARLDIDLVETEAASFREVPPPEPSPVAGPERARPAPLARPRPASPGRSDPPPRRGPPVIVLDPGHGGVDPGARAAEFFEKDVVLSVARHLQRALAERKRYQVHLTRTSDVYIPLDQRVEVSRERSADLFISLHADSLGGTRFAQTVRGASVYTLSEKASNEEAQALADKENASDLVAGVPAAADSGDRQVKGILIDLIRRENADFSTAFQQRLLPHMQRAIGLAREPARSAAFRVLKQTEIPAVLVELGYMSNRQDARLLASRDWQRKVAVAIAAAIDEYFDRRSARK